MITLNLTEKQLDELKNERKKWKNFSFIRRIECILYRHEKRSNKYIKEKLGISDDSIALRIKTYIQQWIHWLLDIKFSERRISPVKKFITDIRQYVQTNKITTLKDLWSHLKDKYQLDYTISNLSRLAKKNWIWVWRNQQQSLEK